ncbi:hypothetical protein NPIL_353981 [Nephila pilipes]|uniref:Uncharacterized protein n=1 Tax=Nephila pilipes TaxID=299642 RepID=A0A8X6Q4P5_NEPPI|nr:hypothetical protein NPIL_353981 [Nephila pilipes]
MDATIKKDSTTSDVEDRDISFSIPLGELDEILIATEMVDEFAAASPIWDDDVSRTQQPVQEHVFCKLSTNKEPTFHIY